ncbi:E3 ubiquitin-protein ligase ZNRF2-like isoform X2 [Periophthalmus magnuspinnatus]|uniref:E3 ubiquitin-protein ligase ZNRF2-like isoform X2 n=1 Tax=Periophthalmus magnuspinnatus TaxID=409849 RepID=UPI002436FE4F|nr:E3 ubiquitin-protein ligase ZNRF2-like isoform X2 [Periophthalmus magnuspinnatus]
MGGKQSSPVFDGRTRAYSSSDLPSGNSSGGDRIAGFRYTNGPEGPRIRYTGGGPVGPGLSIPTGRTGPFTQSVDGTDGDHEVPPEGHRLFIGSLPAQLNSHLLGEDILSRDSGECAICLDEMEQGDTIARLPCLCIYHKGCIDEWFEVNRSCPEHPAD